MEKNFYWLSEEALLDLLKKQRKLCGIHHSNDYFIQEDIKGSPAPPLPAPIHIPTDEEIQKEAIKYAETAWGDFSNDITNYGTGMTNGDISEKDFLAGYRYLKEKIKQ